MGKGFVEQKRMHSNILILKADLLERKKSPIDNIIEATWT
jgi:hypothetical protein